eukprot:scaffold18997_cov28-Tisochrysis_lutea.AAC.2
MHNVDFALASATATKLALIARVTAMLPVPLGRSVLCTMGCQGLGSSVRTKKPSILVQSTMPSRCSGVVIK